MDRLGDLRGRVFDEEQPLRGGVGFQQAGDHHSQGLGGGKRGRRHKGEHHRPHRVGRAGRRQPGCHPNHEDAGQVDKEGGRRGHRLPVERHAVGRLVDLPVLPLHLLQPAGAKAENLDIPQAIDALQHQGFHLPQPGAVPHAHSPARLYSRQGKHHADHQIHRQQYGSEQGLEPQRQP